MFELEATEETVEAAQEEEEITRINNSLVLPVSSTQTTTTRIESSVFIPVSSTGSADGVVQALVEAIKDQGIEVESFTFDPETGELSYVVKIVNYAGSGSQSLENTIEGALEQEGEPLPAARAISERNVRQRTFLHIRAIKVALRMITPRMEPLTSNHD